MRPDQCGTGRPLEALDPADAAAVREFGEWLTARKTANQHQVAVATIMAGKLPLELVAGAPFHKDDFVKVANTEDGHDGSYVGRWGIVTEVIDYRGVNTFGQGLDFLVMVALKTTMPGVGLVDQPPAPMPFEAWELEQLFGTAGGPGDWVRRGRVVSRANWPRSRDGLSA